MTNVRKALLRAHKARNRAARTIKLMTKRGQGRRAVESLSKVSIAYKPLYRKIGRDAALRELRHMSSSYRMQVAETYKQLKTGFNRIN